MESGRGLRACRALLAVSALGVALPASAEIYKWVDDQGVTNYSQRLPPERPAQPLSKVPSRVSMYSPPPLPALRTVRDPALESRIDQLERQLYRERQGSATLERLAAERELRRIERCREQRLVDCDDDALFDGYGGFAIYAPPFTHSARPLFDHRHDGRDKFRHGLGKHSSGERGGAYRVHREAIGLPGTGAVRR